MNKRIIIEYMDAKALVEETQADISLLKREGQLLKQRKEKAETLKTQAEIVINQATPRMQRIIRFKLEKGLSWNMVAIKMGRGATAESVRKEFERFLSES